MHRYDCLRSSSITLATCRGMVLRLPSKPRNHLTVWRRAIIPRNMTVRTLTSCTRSPQILRHAAHCINHERRERYFSTQKHLCQESPTNKEQEKADQVKPLAWYLSRPGLSVFKEERPYVELQRKTNRPRIPPKVRFIVRGTRSEDGESEPRRQWEHGIPRVVRYMSWGSCSEDGQTEPQRQWEYDEPFRRKTGFWILQATDNTRKTPTEKIAKVEPVTFDDVKRIYRHFCQGLSSGGLRKVASAIGQFSFPVDVNLEPGASEDAIQVALQFVHMNLVTFQFLRLAVLQMCLRHAIDAAQKHIDHLCNLFQPGSSGQEEVAEVRSQAEYPALHPALQLRQEEKEFAVEEFQRALKWAMKGSFTTGLRTSISWRGNINRLEGIVDAKLRVERVRIELARVRCEESTRMALKDQTGQWLLNYIGNPDLSSKYYQYGLDDCRVSRGKLAGVPTSQRGVLMYR